ncbi:hypothetical protein PV325_003922 [Microctonus aethiopoides]|nr:hypothetical protein PV325_003922 [Microctonus aethiopoides]
MANNQLGLLLWKNYVVRKRRPVILGFVFLWPIAVFMLLYTVRDNVDPEYNPTCQFPARLMPHDGLLPFVQSYICNIGNPCEPFNQYEEVPSFKNATLGPLMMELQPVLKNETILNAVKTLPQSVQFVKSMAEILTKPEIKKIFDRGIKLGDLFNNHDVVKQSLKAQMPNVRDGLIDDLFEASIKLYYLIESFGSSNIDGIICSPESLMKFLNVPKQEDIVIISEVLCNLDQNKIPEILERLAKHLDFNGLLEVVSRVMAKFKDYDFINDITKTVNTILELSTVKKYVPNYLKLSEWMPEVLALFKDVKFKTIDVSFINKSIEKMDVVFIDDPNWTIARDGLYKFNSLLGLVKEIIEQNNTEIVLTNSFDLSQQFSGNIKSLSNIHLNSSKDITKILDITYLVLQDGVKLVNKLLDRHANEIELATEILNGLREIFPNKIMNTLTYLVSMVENVVLMTHHVAIIHEEIPERMYNISKKHEQVIKKILIDIDPEAFRMIIESFSRLDFVENIIEKLKKNSPADVICNDDIFKDIFYDFNKTSSLHNVICNNETKLFIMDIYKIFEFGNFRKIVENTLSTFVNMAFSSPVSIQKSNLTSAINSVNNLVNYLKNSSQKKTLDWNNFDVPVKWQSVFNNTQSKGRLDILGYHLSIARIVGSHSLSYVTIKPDLENMDAIADIILQDLREYPSNWINQVREHSSELLESFYLTVIDKNKTLKILEYSNFTRSYCMDRNSPNLINYPTRSNKTLLKGLVCRLARSVQTELEINLTSSEFQEMIFKDRKSFNWTAFNGKLLKIYAYIDTLIQFEHDNYYLIRLNELKMKFTRAWSTDLSTNHAWEMSVGLLCKLFDVAESPLFNLKSKSQWQKLYALAWSLSAISHNVERILDDIFKVNSTIRLPDVMKDMPQTEFLLDIVLRNLPAITRDILDLITQKSPIQYISVIFDLQKREIYYPCVQNQSLGEALQLRPGTKQLVREIERISCNPGQFIKEWEQQPLIMKLEDIFNDVDSNPVPVFNWTAGYSQFRRIVNKIIILVNSPSTKTLNDDQQVVLYSNNVVSQLKNMFNDASPKIVDKTKTLFDYIDLEIDKNIEAFKSNLTAQEVWMSMRKSRGINEILVMAKFGLKIIHDIINVIFDIFHDNTERINLLSLLGFTSKSSVTIIRNRLPYILATIIYGVSDPALDHRIIDNIHYNKSITCSEVFSSFWDYKIGLTDEEYRTLKNFTCDSDPDNFNVFVDLYLKETIAWRAPVTDYQLYFFTLTKELHDVSQLIINRMDRGLNIDPPVNRQYFQDVLKTLKNVLEMQGVTPDDKELQIQWTNYRLIIEGVSQVLNNAATALMDIQLKDGTLHLWDLVRPGNTRQFIKFLETSPIETVSLLASVSTLNSTSPIPWRDLRHVICNVHFNSTFWSQPKEKHFLSRVCSWNHFELLKGATSEEYVNIIEEKNSSLSKLPPLSKSLTKFLDTWTQFMQHSNSNIIFESNIINVTTWKNLPNDTRELIHDAQLSWMHKLIVETNPSELELIFQSYSDIDFNAVYNLFEDHPLNIMRQIVQLVESWLDITSGGDIWQKLRMTFEQSKVKVILNLIEDSPNLIITMLDTFLNSERLNDFTERYLVGNVSACDIDKYLIPSSYIRKKGILFSITNFCQKIIFNNETMDFQDFQPLVPTRVLSEKKKVLGINIKQSEEQLKIKASLNETYFMEQFERFQSTLVRILNEGYKQPKIPTWWTSFQESTLNDFKKQFKNKDLRTLSHTIATKSTKVMRNILNLSKNLKSSCSWCNTRVVEIINSQLALHKIYSDIICKFNRMNVSQLQEMIDTKLYWKKTIGMVKNFDYLTKKQDIEHFMIAIESALHYVTDIIVDYKDSKSEKNVSECMMKAVNGFRNFSPGIYVKILVGVIDALQKNLNILDNPINRAELYNHTRLAEKFVPIWKPLVDIVKKSTINEVNMILPNASLNVNLLMGDRNDSLCPTIDDCLDASRFNDFINSKRAHKLLRYDQKISNYPSASDVSKLLATSLDFKLINNEIYSWRNNASWSFFWLKDILQHLTIILEESGSLLDVASKIDFEDVSNVLGVPDIADGVVNLLRDKTIDKLFAGFKELLEDIEPFLNSTDVKYDLYSIVNAFESMEIFKNLGLLDMKYVVSEMFLDWNTLRKYLLEDVGISNEAVAIVSQARVDMLSVFMKERSAINLKDTVCSQERLTGMLSFEESKTNAEEVGSILCSLNSGATQNIAITLIQNVNFDYVFKNLMTANVKNILKNANLTESEGKVIFDNIGVVAELVPFFKDKLTSGFSPDGSKSSTNGEEISNGKFLRDSSEMLCGRPLISDSSEFYRLLSSLKDKQTEFDDKEMNSLPTEFCRDTYKNFVGMSGGKIVWSYVKPLLRGRILYTPKSSVIKEVMALANQTFSEIDTFGQLMSNIEKTLVALVNLSDMGSNLRDLKDIMSSKVMKLAIKTMSDGRLQGDLSNFDLSDISWKLKKSDRIIKMIGMLNNLVDCVLVDRMIGFDTEEELELESKRLIITNEFLAGVVFLNTNERMKRSFEHGLPDNIIYKIRMDVDYVPSTKRLKNQFWIPGPEDSFIEDLRYLRGFVQLQDSIDRAIIEIKSGKKQNWKTLSQQMPYPCWKRVPFQSTLYESQGLVVCFFFALMMCVGSAVRYIVWERESQNAMVMSVMGLKPWCNTFAWYLISIAEAIIVVLSIAAILIVGKILPQSDPSLIIILLLDYAFSIVAFCYMISTMFSSASLAAVTAVVIFLLTFMPYIIVIAMEASLEFGYNILLCLSMSTSFCYGCLFAARREVQETGLTWNTMWEETIPGDPMSLGFVLLMIALDGILYAIIGYLVTRYTNSVDEDSDLSNINVNEKQIGVKFEGVSKIYHTERGDVVAVDDFSLKLCEGEVTSLLGRNGAGKTTIIKMLTGMITPTCGEIYINGDETRKPDIGVCPQDNVLIDTLTAREHMTFYAKLKQPLNNDEMMKNVDNILTSLQLGRQEHEPISRLSGGTKRRLCVALAFLGSPKLVILDEPGAGVDPAARRRIWRLIDQHRVNRTVLLSTHHLDEADMLSDTVVLMHRGKILCTGSPLAIKTSHGQGYWMNVTFPHEELRGINNRKIIDDLRSLMENIVPNALVNDSMTDEVMVNLPFQGKHGMTNDISSAIKALEDNKKSLGFSCVSLECDTLERVFLDLCSRAETGVASTVHGSTASVASISSIGVDMVDDTETIIEQSIPNPSVIRQAKVLIKKRMWHFTRNWRAPLAALILPTMFVAIAMGFSLIRPPSGDEPALDVNPKLYDTHPTYFYSIDSGTDPFLQHISLQLHDRFGDDYAGAWQIHPNDTGTCECSRGQQVCHGVSKAVEGLFQTLPGRPTLDWIISTFNEYIEKRYGGWSLSHWKEDPLFVVWFNNKGHHSLPAYLNALNEAILRASGVPGHLKTLNHPLKLSSDQLNRTTLLQHVSDVGVALVLLVAFSLVAAEGARELVRERLSEEKRILYLAGVHPVTYWTTALVWDFIVFICSIGLAVVVFEIFGLSAYVARDNLPGVCLLLVLFAWASIPFSHLIEKTFDESSLANMVLFCLNTFIGVICLATILVIDILGKSQTAKDTRQLLHNFMLLFPQYALGDALVKMSTNDITSELLERFNMDTYKSPLGWELIGPNYTFLFVVGMILYVINLAIECRMYSKFYCQRKRVFHGELIEDEDVARERIRVETGANSDILKTVKLHKEYNSVLGTNVAVKNLSIGVQAGTCFGLLGVNGAGKSTTFKMLTTELIPTAGKIILRNQQLGLTPLANGEIGYCPQTDALDGFLTPHQCLTIQGEVCGLNNVPKSVEIMLNRFDLLKYAHQRVSSLSGGNKRKLCAAISVMSPVSVVLMDEPTSGMDPASKELVARAIRQVIRAQGAVIMTSHSVSECEKLCSRVGILARAGLRCIGTVQHLKHKFGEGYVAFLRFNQPVTIKELKDAISRHLSKAQISSRQAAAARLLVPRAHDMTLSETFSSVKRLAEDLKATDYTLTQSSLDQNARAFMHTVIIDVWKFASHSFDSHSSLLEAHWHFRRGMYSKVLVNFSEDLDDDLVDSRYKETFTNSYATIADTIHMDTF